MNTTETLKSGTTIQITSADFQDAMALVRAIKKASVGIPPTEDISSVVILSEEVEQALFRCFKKVLYQDRHVDKGLFDDPVIGEKARKDYFEMCGKVIKANCDLFFDQASLGSMEPPKAKE